MGFLCFMVNGVCSKTYWIYIPKTEPGDRVSTKFIVCIDSVTRRDYSFSIEIIELKKKKNSSFTFYRSRIIIRRYTCNFGVMGLGLIIWFWNFLIIFFEISILYFCKKKFDYITFSYFFTYWNNIIKYMQYINYYHFFCICSILIRYNLFVSSCIYT